MTTSSRDERGAGERAIDSIMQSLRLTSQTEPTTTPVAHRRQQATYIIHALAAAGIVLSDRETSVVVGRERYDILVNAAEDALNDARHELTQWRADDDRARLQQWVDKLDAALRAGSDTP